MVSATAEGLERCPAEAVAAWRVQLTERLPAPARAAVQRSYDRAVAEWAVCAHARQLNSWNVPDVADPAADDVIRAVLLPPGSRARVEAIERAAVEMPVAAALLALDELAVLDIIAHAEPAQRAELVMGALGAFACPVERQWLAAPGGGEAAICPGFGGTETVAYEALAALGGLAAPALQPSPLADLLRPEIDARWDRVEAFALPLPGDAPLGLLPSALGTALLPELDPVLGIGAAGWAWYAPPQLRLLRRGVVEQPTWAPVALQEPPLSPLTLVEGSVTLEQLAATLAALRVPQPRLAVARPGGLAEVPLRLVDAASTQPAREGALLLPLTVDQTWEQALVAADALAAAQPPAGPAEVRIDVQLLPRPPQPPLRSPKRGRN